MKNKKQYYMIFRPVLTILLFIFLMPVAVKGQTLVGPGGLTQSVIDAAAADDILELTGDQTLTTTLIISKSLTIKGQGANPDGTPAIVIKQTGDGRHFTCATADITINFENVALIGPNATYAGGVVTSNDAVASGGGIANTQKTTTVNVSNCIIAGCRATTAVATTTVTGGGISVAGPLTVSSSSILYNTTNAGNGGGIYAGEISTLSGNNTVSYNKAGWTGTDYSETAYTGGGIHAGAPPTELSGTLICKGNGASGSGGGIYKAIFSSVPYPNAFITTGLMLLQVDDNESKASGGGIYTAVSVHFPDLQEGSSISNNTAETAGGGIYLDYSLTLNNTTISNNTAKGTSITHNTMVAPITGGGGGLCGASYTQSIILLNNCTIDNNRTESYGGGLYFITIQTAPSMAPTLNNCTVTNNSAARSGGGVYAWGHLALKGTNTISNNQAGSTSMTGHGGGIYVHDLTLNIADTLICKKNNAYGNGGGIYKTFVTNGSNPITVTDLKLLQLEENVSKYAGGGIYSTVHINFTGLPKGSSISGNRAGTFGGGMAVGSVSGTGDHLQVIKLSNLTINDNTAAQHGGGIYAPGPLTISGNTTVSGNRAGWTGTAYTGSFHGGGIYAIAGLTLTDTLTCERNGASGYGGGIYKVLTIVNIPYYPTIFNAKGLKLLKANDNTAIAGGGIYTANSVNLGNLQKGSSISRNTANSSSGGGIFMLGDTASLTLNNTAVKENTAAAGGGIYTTGPSAITNSTLNGNIANNGGGGGIYTTGLSTVIHSSTANNNTAKTNGGGIYADKGLTLSGNDTISFNKAGWTGSGYAATNNYGGGVYVNGKFILNDTLACNGNMAAGAGGGIYKSNVDITDAAGLRVLQLNNNEAGKGTASNGNGGGAYFSSSGNQVDFSNAVSIEIKDNIANNWGGGVYASEAIRFKNATIINNVAACHGGGISAYEVLTFSGKNTISFNKAGWTEPGYSTTAYYGGGIMAMGNLVFSDTLMCNNNSASGAGGGIFKNTPTATIDATNLIFLQLNNNEAGKGAGGAGGGAYLAGSATVGADFSHVTSAEIIGNKSSDAGGGIYSVGLLSLKNANVNNNTAKASGGGISAATVSIVSNSTVSNNTASNYGGGIFTNGSCTINNSTINNNIAAWYGGGIYTNSATTELTLSGNDTISNNKAGWNGTVYNAGNYPGGGIYVNGKFIVKDTLVCNDNMSAGAGGGIYKSSISVMDATGLRFLQLINNEAGKGTATNGYGGGAFFSSSGNPIDFSNAASIEIRENIANSGGGGIYATEAVRLKNATIIDNVATSHGGGIYAANILTLKGKNTISDNKAGWTGADYGTAACFGGGILAMDNLVFSDTLLCNSNMASGAGGGIFKNTATATIDVANLKFLQLNSNEAGKGTSGAGGGAYLAGSATVGADFTPVTAVEIIGNKASGNGGGIYSIGTLSFKNTTISNNTSENNGGGIFVSADFQSNANTFAGNQAVNGGGIYLNNTATILNSTFSANTATTYGGAVYANASAHNITLSAFNGNTPSAIYFTDAANQTLNGNILYGNGTQDANIAPAPANYNIVRGLDWGGTNKNVAAGKADSIFAVADNATDLATLADNGGPTETLLIKQDGLAHDFIPNSVFYPWNGNVSGADQRGLLRPFGCKADAGAVELQVEKPLLITVGVTGAAEACTGDEVLFTGETGYAIYNWSGDSGIPKGNGDTYQEYFKWTTGGTKTVTLAVDDGYGCTSSGTKTILIHLRPETGPIYRIPNLQ